MRSRPSRRAVPLSGSNSVARIFIKVDLPAPFGPIRPNMPTGISRETPRRARTFPGYVLASPWIESTGPTPWLIASATIADAQVSDDYTQNGGRTGRVPLRSGEEKWKELQRKFPDFRPAVAPKGVRVGRSPSKLAHGNP